MSYQEILKRVSEELELPVEVVKEAYESYWLFIRQSIIDLPLKENLDKEDFNKLRTNFNIPSIGKMSVTWERYLGKKKQWKVLESMRHV